jgi:GTP cyclohydrolase I
LKQPTYYLQQATLVDAVFAMPMSPNTVATREDILSSEDHKVRANATWVLLQTVPNSTVQITSTLNPHAPPRIELREGLQETPNRVANAWEHWLSGYEVDPRQLLKSFEDGADGYDEMVLVKDLPFYSLCEHHLAPFFGRITIGYLPQGKVVGLSKLARVSEAFSRRLQVQERLTVDIAQCVMNALQPLGVGVLIRARHLCMESRGVCQSGHSTTTQCLLGLLRDDHDARAEFIELAKSDVPL